MNTNLKRNTAASTILAGVVLCGGALAAWAASSGVQLMMNGKTASSDVRTIGGKTYVPLADVARALDMVVVRNGGGYEIRKAGGASPIQGVTQGRIGDVLFDGKWRFQVLKMETLGSYAMKTDSDTYDSAGLSRMNRDTHAITPKDNYKLIVLQCRVTNGRNSRQRLWTAISDDKINTALTDMNGGSYPPVAYDYDGAPTQTTPMVAGAIKTFPVIFSVPNDARIKDLIFTLHSNGDSFYNDVRVSLAP